MKEKLINNGYTIFASDITLLQELNSKALINWNNFSTGDDFYSEESVGYEVLVINHTEKYVVLV